MREFCGPGHNVSHRAVTFLTSTTYLGTDWSIHGTYVQDRQWLTHPYVYVTPLSVSRLSLGIGMGRAKHSLLH